MDRLDFLAAYVHGREKQIRRKLGISGRNHYQRKILFGEDASKVIFDALMAPGACMIGRFGASEGGVLTRNIEIQFGLHKDYGRYLNTMVLNAGFFPKTREAIDKYCEFIKDIYSDVDILAPMGTLGDEYIIKKYCKNPILINLAILDPFYSWTKALEGKRVLVIHPFARSIEEQYKRIDKIYPNGEVPHFELQTIQAVQSVGGLSDQFSSWFEALDYMVLEIKERKFDIALIGCGAYGFPLAVNVKRMGKKAVHVGGALQLFFGIKGKRWVGRPLYDSYINEYWINPSMDEKPVVADKIEGGCYWM